MEDVKIVQLYWDRNEQAISATADKYGNHCASIAKNILGSKEDAEECVNDTYMSAWKSMPPHRPNVLRAFLGKITRNLSFNRYKYYTANKRGSGNAAPVLDEIAELVSDADSIEQEVNCRELVKAMYINVRRLLMNLKQFPKLKVDRSCGYCPFSIILQSYKNFHYSVTRFIHMSCIRM